MRRPKHVRRLTIREREEQLDRQGTYLSFFMLFMMLVCISITVLAAFGAAPEDAHIYFACGLIFSIMLGFLGIIRELRS